MKYLLLFFTLPCFAQEAAIIDKQDSGIVIINHIMVNNKMRWYVDKVYTKKNNTWEEYMMVRVTYSLIEAKYLIKEYEQFKEEANNKRKAKKLQKEYGLLEKNKESDEKSN